MPWSEAEGNSVVLRAPRTYDLTMTGIKCSQGLVLSCLYTIKDSHLFCWKYWIESFGSRKFYEKVNSAHRAAWTVFAQTQYHVRDELRK